MRRIIIALITMISIHGSVHAQEFDCRPLTCTMKNAGDYNVELAGCRNTLDIYLYDKDLMPVRGKSLSGYVEFFYSSDPPLQSRLVQYHRTNAMTAKILAPDFIIAG